MKRTYMLFGMTLLFSLFLLAVNAWGAPYISFNSKRTGQSDIIYIIDTNGKNLRNLTNHPADDTGATWAPDGRSFAFVLDLDGNNEIYIKTFNVAQARRLTNHPELDFSPSWSPDGNWIAFVAGRTGGLHIYKIDINGKNLQRLTNQGKYNLDPDWSPDGQSIAFGSALGSTYVMDADGKHPRSVRLLVDGVVYSYFQPAWSPDGKQIACVVFDDGNDIYIMDTDGQNARRVSPLGTWSYNPAWSLDGKWIAYDAYDEPIANPPDNPNAVRHIFIVSVEGGEPRQITQHPGPNYSPAWVPESFFSVSPTVDTQTTLWGRLKQAERMTQ
jgi:Tol biopolymer transport system component